MNWRCLPASGVVEALARTSSSRRCSSPQAGPQALTMQFRTETVDDYAVFPSSTDILQLIAGN